MKQSTAVGRLIAPVFNRLPYAALMLDYLRGVRKQPPLTRWQTAFVAWNAERLGISQDESRQRYQESMGMFRNRHGGLAFSRYTKTLYTTFGVFAGWNEKEAYETYRFFAPAHFLRMLSYPETHWPADHPLIATLKDREPIVIGDFGCGLAQHSIALVEHLGRQVRSVRLVLADIPTIRKDFLLWLCNEWGIDVQWIDTAADNPLPHFPALDVCVATEVFEHLDNPVPYFKVIDASLKPDGLLYTQVKDHGPDPSHFSTDLSALRESLKEAGYREILPYVLYQKPALS